MSIDIPENHLLAQAFGDLRFRFYPCGFTPDAYFPVLAYVRYKPLNRQSFDQPVKVIDRGYRWVMYDTPDREVLFTREGLTLGGDRPLNDHGEPWHHAVSFAINAPAGDDIPYDRYMINPHAITDRTAPKMRKEGTIMKSDKIVMSDCLTWDTLVPTNKGVFPIGYIVGNNVVGKQEYTGDLQVFDALGTPTKITHVFASEEERPIHRMLTKQGYVIEGSPNHLIEVLRAGKPSFVTMADIRPGDKVLLNLGFNCWSESNVKVLSKNRSNYKHDHVTPELATLMGIVSAAYPRIKYEGENAVFYFAHFKAVELLAKYCLDLFGFEVTIDYERSALGYKVTVPAASHFFTLLNKLGAGLQTGSQNRIRAPWSIIQSTKECVVAYLYGWFVTNVRVKDNDLSILVRNDTLAQHIGTLLLYLGIANFIMVSKQKSFVWNIVIRDFQSIKRLLRTFDLTFVDGIKEINPSTDSTVFHVDDSQAIGYVTTEVLSCSVVRQAQVFDITLESEDHAYYAGPGVYTHNSGGFQLGHGGVSFINPITLSEFYSDNVDEGVVLDIPARQIGDDPEIMKHTAKVHKLNVEMMLKHLPKGFRLANVVHGHTLKIMDDYRAKTEHIADYSICCIGGMLRYNLVEAVYRVMYIISTGRKYKQYHLLGASNPPFLAAMIRLAYMYKKSGEHIMITNDSSSPIGFAIKRTYYSQPGHYDALTPTRYGIKMSSSQDTPAGNLDNPHRRFATNDPISSLLGGYLDFIHADNNIMSRTYAVYQNQIELARYVNQMCWYAEHLDDKDYRELAQTQYRASVHGNMLVTALDFMVVAFEQGLDVAYNKYKSYMPNFTGDFGFKKFPSLFEGSEELSEDEETLAANKKRLIKVIKGYYKFHKTGVEPEKLVAKSQQKGALQLLI